MSISPINFNGMIQNTNEISNTKAQEDQKPLVQQAAVSLEISKREEQQSRSVNDADNAREQEYRYDRKGNGSGYNGSNSKKKKDEKEKNKSEGIISKQTPRATFDIKI